METAPLKSFATWARTALIREVTARIAVVLAPASSKRVEQPTAVETLEKAVTAAGGGDKGKAAVADKVAYTWFNRIIALRFMDANGYTGIGVVSPQAGVETGQPEILAEAKRGNFDTAVVGGKTCETVTALLNGTRQSDDAQGEAYALLLADYCHYWNRAMPFMFEHEGDFTELLIPANLLADDSVPSRAVKVLTKDVCQDVEVIGWLYQFYISERKDEVFAGFKKNKKAGADEIPAATQLFTPHWIVRYLVENSLGRLWMLNRPTSRLVDQMQYYIAPVDQETDFLKITGPEELKVVDPACGSGHMLTYAFDLLYAIYEEEGYAPAAIPALILTNNLYGVEIDPRAGALAAFALNMKARAKQRTFFNKKVESNVCVLDPIRFTPDEIDFLLTRGGDKHAEADFWNQFEHADTFGSLIQPDPELTARLKQHIAQLDDGGDILLANVLDWAERVVLQAEYLAPRYATVVANPPYMGSGNMNARLSEWTKRAFPKAKADLFACFIERAAELAVPLGRVAMITMQSWMFLSSFAAMRAALLKNHALESMAHLGTGAFDSIGGAVVSTTAFVFEVAASSGPGRRGAFVRLVDDSGERGKSTALLSVASGQDVARLHVSSSSTMLGLPGAPIAYAASPALVAAMSSGVPLGEMFQPRTGMNTGDNARFVRDWWEVSSSKSMLSAGSTTEAHATDRKWFPYNKGGAYRRWYGNQQSVIAFDAANYEILSNQGNHLPSRQYYFQPCVAWTKIATSSTSFRLFPQGFVFDGAGVSLFADTDEQRVAILGFLNSSVAERSLELLSPTLNFQSGDIARLPAPPEASYSEVAATVGELVDVAKSDWDSQELSWGFQWNPLLSTGSAEEVLLAERCGALLHEADGVVHRQAALEEQNNEIFARLFQLDGEVRPDVRLSSVSLWCNSAFLYESLEPDAQVRAAEQRAVIDLVSYATGCMFGRYSLDEPGVILADQGTTVQDYLVKVPNPTFAPDKDNVIPIVDGDWFEDDIVARFRTFLRVAFGKQHFEENLRFVTESLGVKDIREYFVRTGTRATSSRFYDDHVQRYKKRPIYWLFSSPKGSFNALIYMHRYTPSTVSTVLNEYLREFRAKLSSSLQQQDRLAASGGTPRQQAAAQKEADRLRKVLLELEEYEHDMLYPLASRQLAIDLDDGVKANYPRFGAALKRIPGLEATDE
ncbi:BREX-1 system adenine-specific DNA-methyltransferase PglX [Streptacidiphilus sp. PB12-B1b]|uniref:BREX-1 system adenine-specific DNA-methyltransferase PglX n=1 Tax=Streptacidiphilus sp. PB12-B1b TaxID=2705012 RepID=UPI0015FBB2F1|nr:BREX-1 system adenine-specific DNA-methyltransferase PglX [Streptacidiphilus sp. PB12-B1b]QMU74588.1 BREX-1 system adenine-specific DNA-methyltransferase PglX [Streptacidiphilus sp. PB12-B1b]